MTMKTALSTLRMVIIATAVLCVWSVIFAGAYWHVGTLAVCILLLPGTEDIGINEAGHGDND